MPNNAVRFAVIAALAFAATACSRSSSSREDAAEPASETVSDVAASSEAPAASDAASDASAVVKEPGERHAHSQSPQDLDPDEVAATGDTRRHQDLPPASE